jgi:hypothetical protein
MQKYIINGQKQSTYKPDVLVRGNGVGWRDKSQWYRQTGDDYGHNSLTAKFRPTGWDKTYEYEVSFNDRTGIGKDIKISVNRINKDGIKISTNEILGMTTKVENKNCPFCNNLVIMDQPTTRWKCTSSTCQFNYTSDTCKLMYEDLNQYQSDIRKFGNFNGLHKLANSKRDMDINIDYHYRL